MIFIIKFQFLINIKILFLDYIILIILIKILKYILLNQSTINQITINNSNSYNYIIYCNSYKVINI